MIRLTHFFLTLATCFILASGAQAASFMPLGNLPGSNFSAFARGVSDDGGVVVGVDSEAFRWTLADGMEGLGRLPGGTGSSVARGVSADGKVVVGDSDSDSPDGNEAFRWTEAGGMEKIGDLGGEERGKANAVSADGSVIVGLSTSELGLEAFRWTASGGMVGIGDIPDGRFGSEATDVSADGSVVVGNSRSASGNEGFVWTQAIGMERLQDVLVANGTTGLSGWGRLRVGGISSNGQWIVGSGTNPSGFNEAFLVWVSEVIFSDGFE
jgi:probable HAF family extracellular repeat protein